MVPCNGSTKKNGNSGQLGFEAELFLAADKLRGNLEPSEYKHVVLGLLHQAYLEADLDLVQTREPHERFMAWHEVIDRQVAVSSVDGNGDGGITLIFRLPEAEEIPLTGEPSRLLFQLDRQAYIAAFEVAKQADASVSETLEDLP
jgi:hypothetical protein